MCFLLGSKNKGTDKTCGDLVSVTLYYIVIHVAIIVPFFRVFQMSCCHANPVMPTQSFQGNTSVVCLIVLCVGVVFILCAPYACFHVLVFRLGN